MNSRIKHSIAQDGRAPPRMQRALARAVHTLCGMHPGKNGNYSHVRCWCGYPARLRHLSVRASVNFAQVSASIIHRPRWIPPLLWLQRGGPVPALGWCQVRQARKGGGGTCSGWHAKNITRVASGSRRHPGSFTGIRIFHNTFLYIEEG